MTRINLIFKLSRNSCTRVGPAEDPYARNTVWVTLKGRPWEEFAYVWCALAGELVTCGSWNVTGDDLAALPTHEEVMRRYERDETKDFKRRVQKARRTGLSRRKAIRQTINDEILMSEAEASYYGEK